MFSDLIGYPILGFSFLSWLEDQLVSSYEKKGGLPDESWIYYFFALAIVTAIIFGILIKVRNWSIEKSRRIGTIMTAVGVVAGGNVMLYGLPIWFNTIVSLPFALLAAWGYRGYVDIAFEVVAPAGERMRKKVFKDKAKSQEKKIADSCKEEKEPIASNSILK